MTILFLCVDAALFFNSYVNPVALAAMNWKYYIVYDAWLAVELVVVYWFYIETRNTPLEEIVKFFDGESALLGGNLATEKAKVYLGANEDESSEDKIAPVPAYDEVQTTPATQAETDIKDSKV